MGLAASQSRFLAVTARKNACEFRSMGLAQEKLSLTRDLQRATELYNSKINATKLVWNIDGSGAYAGFEADLDYEIMMDASPMNDYLPYLVTDKRGQVVLDSRLARAAMIAGIPERGGVNPTIAGRNAFVLALGEQGIIPPSVAEKILTASELQEHLYSNIGNGGLPMDKTKSFNMNLDQLGIYFDQVLTDATKGTVTKNGKEMPISESQLINIKALANLLDFKDIFADKTVSVDGAKTTSPPMTLTDLLENDVVLFATDATKGNILGSSSDKTTFFGRLKEVFKTVFEGDANAEDSQAIQYAMRKLEKTLAGSVHDVTKKGLYPSGSAAADRAADAANEYNTWTSNKSINAGTQYTISLSNLVDSFLTYYAQALGDYDDSGYGVDKKVDKSVLVKDDPGFMWQIKNVYNEDAYDTKDVFFADFYNAMYNNMCQNGWTKSSQDLHDKDYLQNALKNGQLFISSLNNEGYYYQGEYTRNGHVMEVKDEDAVARAEADYNQAKNRLNYKEEMIEIDMKNIDMEIAALSAEYDSVKGIIGKNTEKSFSLFQ